MFGPRRRGRGRGDDAATAGDKDCLLYTIDAADEEESVDLGGRRIIKKKKTTKQQTQTQTH